MCKYIDGEYLYPGWVCCHIDLPDIEQNNGIECKTYNGLQRKQCKVCGVERCDITIPEHIPICTQCGSAVLGLPNCPVCGKEYISNPINTYDTNPL